MVSVRSPAASGAKVTVMLQAPLGASEPLQAFVVVKSLTLFPPMATELNCKEAVPGLVTVIVMGLLVVPCVMVGKLRGSGLAVTAGEGGGGTTPAPLSIMDCGLPGALSVIIRVACCEPVPEALGAKVTLMEQNLFG
jgi:hypothetical protein